MWRSVERIKPAQRLELVHLQVHRNAFPADVLHALHLYILGQPNRKIVHRLTDPNSDVPAAVNNSLLCVPFLGRGNTVITKRYEPSSGSEAFVVHRDPEQYDGHPIVLCTLGGRAILSVITDDRYLIEIDCVPGTAVVAHNNPMHTVTPPIGNETRTFMFSGTDAAQPNWLAKQDAFLAKRESIKVL